MAICKIKCNECETVHSYDCSILVWDRVNSNENNMGTESTYQAVIDEKCSCGKSMRVEFNCYEYPEGVKETSDFEIHGAIMVENNCPSCPDF